MAKKKVTLYIEDTEIKLLVSRGRKIEKWASYALEPTLVRDGAIMDEAGVAAAIRELLNIQKVKERKVTVGLTGLNSIFRVINLPELPAKMIPEAVVNEAARVIPMPLDEVYLAYQNITAAKGELQFFLAAYPRGFTDTLMKTLAKAGLKTTVLDLAPIALARTVDDSRAVIINSWLTNLDIVILIDRLPQVVRSISLSGEDMTPEEKISSVAEEFNRTISFYNSNRKDNPLDTSVPIYVCGDIAQDEGLWQALNLSMLDYTISSISPPIEAPEAFIPCHYMVNIGLALKDNLPGGDDNKFSLVDFNALPEAYVPPSFSWYRILVPVTAVTAVGGLVYFWLIIEDVKNEISVINDQTSALNVQASQIRSQINPIRTAVNEQKELNAPLANQITNLENSIRQTLDLTTVFDSTAVMFVDGLQVVSADLPEILELKPEAVTISSINYQTSFVSINGSGLSEAAVYEYARALRSSERLGSVTVNTINEGSATLATGEEITIYTFTFTVE